MPGGLTSFYAWQGEGATARVVRHWTDDGESYVFEADVEGRSTVVTDQLGRVTRWKWNADCQPTAYANAEGHVRRLLHFSRALLSLIASRTWGESWQIFW